MTTRALPLALKLTTLPLPLPLTLTLQVTILPRVGGPRAFLSSIQNPDPVQMRSFIREGMKAANKRLSHMLHLLALEQAELGLGLGLG